MNAYNPDGWLDILGLFILAAVGAVGTIVPAWILKKRQKSLDKPLSPAELRGKLEGLESDLEQLLTEVTQLRRSSTHFGAASTDVAVEHLRRMAFESEERVKDALRDMHRDINKLR